MKHLAISLLTISMLLLSSAEIKQNKQEFDIITWKLNVKELQKEFPSFKAKIRFEKTKKGE